LSGEATDGEDYGWRGLRMKRATDEEGPRMKRATDEEGPRMKKGLG